MQSGNQSYGFISANPLPQPIGYASIVQTDDDTFYLIGGYSGDGNYLADIYIYNFDDTWEKINELRTPRNKHVSFLVPESLFPECTWFK